MRMLGATGVRRPLAGALAGVLSAAVALGVAELIAGLTGPQGAPLIAVGGVVIDHTPVPVKEFAITHFGTHDKTALLTGMLVILAGFAVLAGIAARRRLAAGLAVLALFGVLGVAAVLTRPGASGPDVLPSLAGALAAGVTLWALVRAMPGPGEGSAAARNLGRRRFLVVSAGAAVVAAGAGAGGDLLLGRFSVAGARSRVRLPAAAFPAAPVPAGAQLAIAGITPFFTANNAFYRVDTDLLVPQVAPQTWTLLIDGMVGRQTELSFSDLLAMPLTEADITMVCVSNQVGGTLTGNARWLGVPLAVLLRRAGVQAGADQVLSTAADGMTISTPLQAIMDGRDALLAVGMNGQPLPLAHGFPARMVVPGLYGYVSATKWVTRLTVSTFARQQAYWTQRGYAAQAPVKTESRIDIPRPFAQLRAGHNTVAGVAWAPATGVAAVQVSVDGRPWHQATLAAADGINTWRQWTWGWNAAPGTHQLQVRAIDTAGRTQTKARASPVPDGASGWDSVVVTVT